MRPLIEQCTMQHRKRQLTQKRIAGAAVDRGSPCLLTWCLALLLQHSSIRSSPYSMSHRATGWSRQDGSAGKQACRVGHHKVFGSAVRLPPANMSASLEQGMVPTRPVCQYSINKAEALCSPTMYRSNMRSQHALYCWVEAVHWEPQLTVSVGPPRGGMASHAGPEASRARRHMGRTRRVSARAEQASRATSRRTRVRRMV